MDIRSFTLDSIEQHPTTSAAFIGCPAASDGHRFDHRFDHTFAGTWGISGIYGISGTHIFYIINIFPYCIISIEEGMGESAASMLVEDTSDYLHGI